MIKYILQATSIQATGWGEILGGQCFMITEVDPMDPLAPCGVHLVIFLSVERSNLLGGSDDHHHRHPRQAVYLRRNQGSDPQTPGSCMQPVLQKDAV